MNSFENLSVNETEKPLKIEQEDSIESLSDQVALETSTMKSFFSKLRTKKLASFLVGVSLLAYQNVYSSGFEAKSKNFSTTYSAFDDKRKRDLKNKNYDNNTLLGIMRIQQEVCECANRVVREEVKKFLNDEARKDELEKAKKYSLIKWEEEVEKDPDGWYASINATLKEGSYRDLDQKNYYEEEKEQYLYGQLSMYVIGINERAKKADYLRHHLNLFA